MDFNLSLYYSSSPKKFYLLPADTFFREGDTILHSTSGESINVQEEDIAFYEVTASEARPYIEKELDETISRFRRTFGLNNTNENPSQGGYSAEKLFESISGEKPEMGLANAKGVLKDFGAALKTLWQAATAAEEQEGETTREKMSAIRRSLEEKGIIVNEKFEELPGILREKHQNQQPGLQESTEQLREASAKLQSSLEKIFEAFKVKKEDDHPKTE